MENSTKYRYGQHSIQGKRRTQEDSHVCLLRVHDSSSLLASASAPSPPPPSDEEASSSNSTSSPTPTPTPTPSPTPTSPPLNFAFFGVFDGHGGGLASQFVAENLPQFVLEETMKKTDQGTDLPGALEAAFKRIEEDFLKKAIKEELKDGTTAIVALLEENDNKLVIGNVGDSELIISNNGKAVSLTPVHNPKRNPDEVKRVEGEGGKLYNDRLAHPCLSPMFFNIAVSRAIGDIFFKHTDYTKDKPSGLSAVPDIVSYHLSDPDEFAILACDGLWDVMTHQEVVDFVLPRLKETNDPQECCQQLVAEAFERGSQDNITALVLTFRPSFSS